MTSASLENRAQALNSQLEGLDLSGRLALVASLEGKSVFTTSLGIEDQVITAAIGTGRFGIEVSTLETGRLFNETVALIDETARSLGFEYFTYLGGRLLMGAKMLGWDPKVRPLHLTSIPEEFRAMYSARRFDAIDPVFKYAAGAIRSTFWSHVYRLRDVSGPAREFVGLSHDFGLNEGIVAPGGIQ